MSSRLVPTGHRNWTSVNIVASSMMQVPEHKNALQLFLHLARYINIYGHAEFRPGELQKLLGYSTHAGVYKLLDQFKEAAFIAEESTPRCVVVNTDLFSKGMGKEKPCRERSHEAIRFQRWNGRFYYSPDEQPVRAPEKPTPAEPPEPVEAELFRQVELELRQKQEMGYLKGLSGTEIASRVLKVVEDAENPHFSNLEKDDPSVA